MIPFFSPTVLSNLNLIPICFCFSCDLHSKNLDCPVLKCWVGAREFQSTGGSTGAGAGGSIWCRHRRDNLVQVQKRISGASTGRSI